VSNEWDPDPLAPERAFNYHLLELLTNGAADLGRIMNAWSRLPVRRDEVRARLGDLVKRGLARREGARFAITEEGRAAMALYDHPMSHWGFRGDDELVIFHVVPKVKK